MAYEPNEWADGAEGETPITAERLNKMEQGILDAQNPAATTWGNLSGKPATFAPTTGTTAGTALAGNTALLKVGTGAADAKAGNYTPTVANVTGLQAALDAKATAAALTALEARVAALEGA